MTVLGTMGGVWLPSHALRITTRLDLRVPGLGPTVVGEHGGENLKMNKKI